MEAAYYREGNKITPTEKNKDGGPKEVLKFESNNKAKKESRKMQQANGGLGKGHVQLVKEEVDEIVNEKGPTVKEEVQEKVIETYFFSRKIARATAREVGGKVIDKGIDSESGKRWAVVCKEGEE